MGHWFILQINSIHVGLQCAAGFIKLLATVGLHAQNNFNRSQRIEIEAVKERKIYQRIEIEAVKERKIYQ